MKEKRAVASQSLPRNPPTAQPAARANQKIDTYAVDSQRPVSGQIRSLENVEAGRGRRDANARVLRSPPKFLDVLLTHVKEEELGRIVLSAGRKLTLVIVLHAHIP